MSIMSVISPADVIAASNADDARLASLQPALAKFSKAETSAARQQGTSAAILLAALTPHFNTPFYAVAFSAFKAASRDARLIVELKLTRAALDIELGKAAKERSEAFAAALNRAASNWSYLVNLTGIENPAARAAGAGRKAKGAVSQGKASKAARAVASAIKSGEVVPAAKAEALAKEAASAAPAIKFNKSYDAVGRLNAMAQELTKAMNAAPKAFNGGAFAVAYYFVKAVQGLNEEISKAQEAAAQN